MTSPPLPKLLTVKQAAEVLSVSVPMVYKLVRDEELPAVRIGVACRVHVEDLGRFIEERRGKKAAG